MKTWIEVYFNNAKFPVVWEAYTNEAHSRLCGLHVVSFNDVINYSYFGTTKPNQFRVAYYDPVTGRKGAIWPGEFVIVNDGARFATIRAPLDPRQP